MADESATFLNPIRAIDLFCGIGGNSWGAKSIGIKIVAGFDKWKLATTVYHDNFPDVSIYSSALEDLDPQQVKNEIGGIDLILASPECTSHSVARGNRTKVVHSLDLAFQVTRFSEVFSPRWILVENVPHMINWDRYAEFIATLKRQGYFVREQVIVASDFGVPQSRKRLFIVCDRITHPSEITPPDHVELHNAGDIIDLDGSYPFTEVEKKGRASRTIARVDYGIQRIGSDKPFLIVYYGSEGTLNNGSYQELDVPLRTVTTLDRFALVKPGKNGHMMRMLQVSELRAAMGFSSEYKLDHGNRREKIHLLGNAVCPPVVSKIIATLTAKNSVISK